MLVTILLCLFTLSAFAAAPPTLNFKNQFGEQTNATVLGGSSQIYCNFIVDSTNGNGLGLRSLKSNTFGPRVVAAYMHTSATPAAGNPNPPAGYILLKLSASFSGYVNGTFGDGAPVSGTPVSISSGLSVHQPYVIVSVGTSTAANWQAVGLPVGVVPNIGASFIATASSPGTGTGVVETIAATGAGITGVQLVGDPNQTSIVPSGAYVMVAAYSGTTITAPADGAVLGFTFNMNQ